MYYIITKDGPHQLTIWFRGLYKDLKQIVQYIIDGSMNPAAFYILLEDRNEMPLQSFADIFHIEKRTLEERLIE